MVLVLIYILNCIKIQTIRNLESDKFLKRMI